MDIRHEPENQRVIAGSSVVLHYGFRLRDVRVNVREPWRSRFERARPGVLAASVVLTVASSFVPALVISVPLGVLSALMGLLTAVSYGVLVVAEAEPTSAKVRSLRADVEVS